jgi:protein-disulfide isomerase
MNNKVVLTILGVVGIVAFLLAAYYATGSTPQQQAAVVESLRTAREGDRTDWAKNSKVVLMEFSDLQCPACAAAQATVEELGKDKEITDNVTFVYRHFPLSSIHPNALRASYAAEAAGQQGKFFEFIDVMFRNQTEWAEEADPTEIWAGYAEDLGLDVGAFRAGLTDKAVQDRVEKDRQSGIEAGINGTPSFFINGKAVENRTVAGFKEALKAEIEAVKNAEPAK